MPSADLARLLAGLDPWAAADVAARVRRLGLPVAVPPFDTDLASCWLADPGELVALPTGTEVLATLAHRPAWMRDELPHEVWD
jgi:hypothetical protein